MSLKGDTEVVSRRERERKYIRQTTNLKAQFVVIYWLTKVFFVIQIYYFFLDCKFPSLEHLQK